MADTLTKIVEIELDASKALNELIQYNKAIEASTALEKQAQEEYGKTSKEYEVQRQKTQALKKEKQTLQREVQNEIKMETKAKDSLNAMRAELSNLTKQYDNLSKAERENTTVGGKLQKQIVEQTKAIKAAEYETERYYRNVGNYTNSILDAIGMNNQLGQALLANGSNFKTMAAVVGNSVKSMNTALMSLMNNPVFIAIAGIVGVGVAFKFWADYNEGIAKATRLTKEFTGLAGQELTDLRSSIQATSEVMGKDYVDVLKSADSLMAHFHITGAEAMDVINKGFAAGADLNGDMLNLLQQNAGAFKDAGISASEMMAIITQTRSGIFSTEGLNIIKQGSIRIREMSAETSKALNAIGINAEEMQRKLTDGTMSTFDGLKQISAKLKELPDNASATGEAIKDVFGKTGRAASQEMIESLATMSTSLDEVLSQTGDYGKLLLEQINTQRELETSTADLFEVQNGGWEAITMKAKIFGNEALTAIVNTFRKVRDALNESWAQMKWWWGNLSNLVSTGFGLFKSVAMGVYKLAGVFQGLGTIIKGVATMSPETIEQGYNAVKSAASGSWSAVTSGISNSISNYKSTKQANDDAWYSSGTSTSGGNFSKPVASGGASSGGGGSTSTGGTTKGGKSGGGSTGKSDAEKAAEKAAKDRAALAKKLMQAAAKMRDDALKKDAESGIAAINKYYAAQRTALEQEYQVLGTKSDEENAAYQQLLEDNEAKRAAAVDDFLAKQKAKAAEEAGALIDLQLQGVQAGSNEEMLLRLAQLDLQYQQEQEKYKNNAAALEALELAHEQKRLAIEQDYANRATAAQQARYDAVAGALGASAQLMEQFGKKSRAAAVASKVLALGEIAVAQGVAIAQGVKDAMAVKFPANIVAIATTIAAIMSTITKAITTVQGAKFATGGYVSGAGTSTSDSIPARLSNGESVLNANSTAMFGSLLSSLNQLGGGAPIQANASAQSVQGEEMLARAFAAGAAALPAPVVGVREFTKVSNQVVTIKDTAKL